jgi:pimeloyl-ACP methyl ester carboxylesterase
MTSIKTKDGVEIFYKDWGKGTPIVFSHGWPLSSDDWDAQMLFFLNKGYRVVAHVDGSADAPDAEFGDALRRKATATAGGEQNGVGATLAIATAAGDDKVLLVPALHLRPGGRGPGEVGGIRAFGHDAFEIVLEHEAGKLAAVAADIGNSSQGDRSLSEHTLEEALALDERDGAHVDGADRRSNPADKCYFSVASMLPIRPSTHACGSMVGKVQFCSLPGVNT